MKTNAGILEAVMAWAERRLDEPLNVGVLARKAGYSVHHFSRMFSALAGESPAAWIERRQVDRAQRLLLDTGAKVIEVALACGFGDAATFARAFRRRTGSLPSAFRSAGRMQDQAPPATRPVPAGLVAATWIEDLPAARLCGLMAEVRGEPHVPGRLWARLMAGLPSEPSGLAFRQLAFWEEDAETRFQCLAGFVSGSGPAPALPFVSVELPAATCLVFRIEGPPERLPAAYEEIYGTLLPASTWRPGQAWVLERYPGGAITEIALPVTAGGAAAPGIA